tara:strand:+ start:764 stop:934 length:171 start_codon:yes stop_codon:yes gene_type:complete
MCLICKDLNLDKLTVDEAWKNLFEMGNILEIEHYVEVYCMLIDKEREERNRLETTN